MTKPSLQAILTRFFNPAGLDVQRLRVCAHLRDCRTAAMGAMEVRCDTCQGQSVWYHGCRDRHCPQCQGRATRQWADKQQARILPVSYFHLVFTVPHRLNAWVALHPEVIYRTLFQAAWATLATFGRDPKRLNGQMGMTAVLHTWGQNLSRHVHLHCLIPGGALNNDGHWKPATSTYLFPVKALSRHFRGKMVSLLRQADEAGELGRVTRPGEVDRLLNDLMGLDWVVYAKDCLHHTENVVRYLSRYTHRIAITASRLISVDDKGVRFRYTDYRDTNRQKEMQLCGEEFLRRYLQHILPKGLMRIRHYGFLGNACHRRKLAQIRAALCSPPESKAKPKPDTSEALPGWPCDQCPTGRMQRIAEIAPARAPARPPPER